MSSVAPVSAQAEGRVVLSSVTRGRAGQRASSFSVEACDLLSIKRNWFGRSGVLGPAHLPHLVLKLKQAEETPAGRGLACLSSSGTLGVVEANEAHPHLLSPDPQPAHSGQHRAWRPTQQRDRGVSG